MDLQKYIREDKNDKKLKIGDTVEIMYKGKKTIGIIEKFNERTAIINREGKPALATWRYFEQVEKIAWQD